MVAKYIDVANNTIDEQEYDEGRAMADNEMDVLIIQSTNKNEKKKENRRQ